jgi:hypothetical protein
MQKRVQTVDMVDWRMEKASSTGRVDRHTRGQVGVVKRRRLQHEGGDIKRGERDGR